MILGIDPSVTSTGLYLHGVPETWLVAKMETIEPKGLKGPERLSYIAKSMMEFVQTSAPGLKVAYVEDYAYVKSSAAMTKLAEARAVQYLILHELGVEIREVSPSQLKKWVGAKTKEETRLRVYQMYSFDNPSNDIVDAFVLAQIGRALESPDLPIDLTKPQQEVFKALAEKYSL